MALGVYVDFLRHNYLFLDHMVIIEYVLYEHHR